MIALMMVELRETVRDVLCEALGAVNMLDTVEMRLVLSGDRKVEEIVTGIRIIKGVATVSQLAPIQRSPGGRRVLDVIATFDPEEMDKMQYVDAMADRIKSTLDVRMVILYTLNGAPVHDETGKRRLVY